MGITKLSSWSVVSPFKCMQKIANLLSIYSESGFLLTTSWCEACAAHQLISNAKNQSTDAVSKAVLYFQSHIQSTMAQIYCWIIQVGLGHSSFKLLPQVRNRAQHIATHPRHCGTQDRRCPGSELSRTSCSFFSVESSHSPPSVHHNLCTMIRICTGQFRRESQPW